LIIAATGRCTRLLPFVEAKDKCYSFRLHLGYETDTLEWDGEVVEQDEREFEVRNSEFSVDKEGVILSETKCSRRISRADVERVLPQFTGDIEQIPPKYCAVKINGVRASDLMERGRNIELKPRKIHIGELKVIGEGKVTEGCSGKEFATFDLICECSKGTYIRALGRDIGRALGTYACVSQIRRHRIGNVAVESAVRGEDLTRENLLPVDAVLDFPVVRLTDEQVATIRQGNWLPWKEKVEGVGPEGNVFAANMQGEVLSLCHYEPGRIKPKFYLGEDEK
jgi:tRNA pseudouridine55 synthase